MEDKNILLNNLDKVHTTLMGIDRIKRNLSLSDADVVSFCIDMIKDSSSVITRRGKNYYILVFDVVITVNAHSYTIITAHRVNKE
ncbi:MAG: DUF3781 domain-containing protein [Bacilli bacterium]|nr:DUF3781 domain-containing protein [Bacilli bacterium]